MKRQVLTPAIVTVITVLATNLVGIAAIAYSPRPLPKPFLAIVWTVFNGSVASLSLKELLK